MAAKQVSSCFLILVFLALVIINVSGISSNMIESFTTIKLVNAMGPYIGLVTVFPPEENGFLSTGAFKPDRKHPFIDLSGRRFRVGTVKGKRVVYVRCGIGMANAAAATQQMLDFFDVTGIVHFGIAGNANNSMSIGDVSIPREVAHIGIWNWLNPNGTVPGTDVAQLEFGSYNVPEGEGKNLLGKIGYSPEEFYSVSGKPNTPTPLFWAQISQHWLQLAAGLQGMELSQCLNSSLCLPEKPKFVVGLRGSTANIFVDNAAYRDFLHETFSVSSVDMESAAVVMTSLSNGYPVIVIRGLSDLAGGQSGPNVMEKFGPLAALNAAQAVIQFISKLP